VKRRCRFLALLITVALAGLPTAATYAQSPNKLQIDGVQVDTTAKTITILGQQFTAGGVVTVTLGEFGDITAQCQTPAPTATIITCTVTPTFPKAGDYRLTVSTGNAARQTDNYDLTIGAVGPPGPTGAQGPAGPAGVIGAVTTRTCPNATSCSCPPPAPAVLTGGATCPPGGVLVTSAPDTSVVPNVWTASCPGSDTPPQANIIVVCYKP
jgi:hypothetical protein